MVEMPLHDQVGMDLARHAGDRVAEIMANTFALCDSPSQASMVAIQVLGTVGAQACGVITSHLGIKIDDLRTPEMLELMADMLREVKIDRDGRRPQGASHEQG